MFGFQVLSVGPSSAAVAVRAVTSPLLVYLLLLLPLLLPTT